MNYHIFREIADSWVLLAMFVFFVGAIVEIGCVIHQAIGHEKEHRHHGCDRVEVAQRYDRQCNDARQCNAALRVTRWPGTAGEPVQKRKDAVARQRLQYSRCAEKGRQRR